MSRCSTSLRERESSPEPGLELVQFATGNGYARGVTRRAALVIRSEEGLRCAIVIGDQPLRVRWTDSGDEEDFVDLPAGAQWAVEGTLLYRVATEPSAVNSDLVQVGGGLRIAIEVLRESGMSLSIPEIKEILIGDYGLARDDVDAALKNLIPKLRSDSRISVHVEEEAAAGDAKGKTVSRGSKKAVSTSVTRFTWVCAESPAREVEQTHPLSKPTPDHAASDARAEESASSILRESLQGAVLPPQIRVGQVPVGVAAAATQTLEEKELAVLCDRFSEAQRWDLAAVLLATPRASKSVRNLVQQWENVPAAEDVLARALAWVVAGAETEAAIRLVDAIRTRGQKQSGTVLASCLACLPSSSEVLGPALLHVITAASPPAVAEALLGTDISAVLTSSANLAMAERSRLLWACWKADPEHVRQRHLWPTRLTIGDLEEWAERSPDSRMLEDPWLQENVVVPALRVYVRDVDRRPGVGRILSWPTSLFELVESAALVAALDRAAATDSGLGRLVGALAREDRVSQLEAEVTEQREVAARAIETADAARKEAQEAMQARQAAFARAAQAEQSQLQASAGELRQAHIDALRAVTDVVATIGRLGADLSAADALQDALTVAARHGVSPIGTVDAVVAYDATRHECLGPLTSDEVQIKEIGFEFDDPDGPVILRRAAVVSHAP